MTGLPLDSLYRSLTAVNPQDHPRSPFPPTSAVIKSRWEPSRLLLVAVLLGTGAAADEADEPDIESLLESTIPTNRELAAQHLGRQGDTAAAKKLIALLDDPDWEVRLEAIRALGPIRFGPGRDALVKMAQRGVIRPLRHQAALMLREFDAKASAHRIARGLKRLKKEARLHPIAALGVIGTEEGIQALQGQMRAPEPEHRAAAAKALDRIGSNGKGLIRGLKDREDEVRFRSAIALAAIDSDVARDALLDFVNRSRDDVERYLLRRIGRRGAAANRKAFSDAVVKRLPKSRKAHLLLELAYHGGLAGCAEIARSFLDPRKPLTAAYAYRVAALGEPLAYETVRKALDHKSATLRFAAATAYLESARGSLEEELRRLLAHENGDVAMVAVRAAVERKVVGVLADLEKVARGKTDAKRDWKLRTAAIVALGRVGYRDGFKPLAELAGAREWWLKGAALEGLFHTYEKESIPILIDAFDDRHPVVRMTVRRNLRYMTHKHYIDKERYEKWWAKNGPTLTLAPEGERIEKAKRDRYATPQRIQEILRGTDIVAIKGRWDKVQLILEDLQVKHHAIRAQQIKDFGLSPKQIVLVNCEGSVDSRTTEYLQWFVVAGGYMATSDWALVNALNKTFPRVLKGYVRQSTGNDVVVVEPASPGHPTLAGVFREHVDLMWWLEIQAFPIAIEDPIRSTVLVDSLQMLLRYGSSVMMAEFPAGLGKVMHSTSHFYLQKEGFAHASSEEERRIFAVDHLGLTLEEIRALDAVGAFRNVNNTTPISRSYSMFHLLVNFIEEKRRIDSTR